MASDHNPETVDAFRLAMRRFPSGVTVVTGVSEDDVHAITVSSFCSVSMSPPLVLVCLNNVGRSAEALVSLEHFGINLLSAVQQEASNACARPNDGRRLEGIVWDRGPEGVPVIDGVGAALVCSPFDRRLAGDHTILVGRVEHVILGQPSEPLTYHDGCYVELLRSGT